jgi:DNA helicase-2/ATP-dependent DNA helicase PcrA
MEKNYGLNDEQWIAVTAKSPSICNASAGSGKTRCLIAKIQYLLDQGATPESILAVTFTNKAANEMKERIKAFYPDLKEMQISTIHSMSVKIINKFVQHTPLKSPFSIYDDSNQLSIIKTLIKARNLTEDPYELLSSISRVKSDGHQSNLKGDIASILKAYQEILIKNNACDFDDLLIYAERCLQQPDCQRYYSDLWQHILVDEFQDTSVIQYKIITHIYTPGISKTFFAAGDINQCIIQGSMIQVKEGIKKIEDIVVGEEIRAGIGKNLTGLLSVKNIYSRDIINMPVICVKTSMGYSLTTTCEHLYFAGFRKCTKNTPQKFYVYLMYRHDRGYRIGFTRNVRGGGKGNPTVRGYMIRMNQELADAIWIIGSYDIESEARYYEHFYSIRYGIPTWVFHTSYRRLSLSYDDNLIEKMYKNTDSKKGALQLLNDLHLYKEYPHHTPKSMNIRRRRNFNITLCCARMSHRYCISGSDMIDMEKLKAHGLNVRPANGRKGYRIEGSSYSLENIYNIRDKAILAIGSVNFSENGRFSENSSLPVTPASHILPGMSCFILQNNRIIEDTVIEIHHDLYTGKIHDLDIDKVHNYIANGIVTHNSIYGWRSARPENMNDFIKKYNPTISHLTYNYRSGSEIIDHANRFLQYGPPMVTKATSSGMVSFTQFQSQEEEAEKIAGAVLKMQNYEGTAILFRVNARTILFEKTFAQKKIPYKIVGTLPFYKRKIAKDLLSYCKAAVNPDDIESLARIVNVPKRGFGETKQERLLLEGRSYLYKSVEEVPRIKAFIDLLEEIKNKSPLEAIRAVLHQTDYRSSLKTDDDQIMVDSFLDVVSGFDSIEELILASNFIEKDSGHGVRLMSAHASKGLEFDRVFVVGVEDELWPHKFSENIDEERRLFYVACTRAKIYLNVSYAKSRICRGKKIDVIPSSLFIDSYKALKK